MTSPSRSPAGSGASLTVCFATNASANATGLSHNGNDMSLSLLDSHACGTYMRSCV
ncbi:hypothetical protein [Bifidobacterium aesculapii]|uniref:hypothetical protein n=1 Tax=Bifidobacterium aesculapii TaxID=1329411 RepID=UPI001364E19A|nr:hypothetical protein [Bifidobacterium aesculapii]